MGEGGTPDFRVLFEKAPGLFVVLDPHFFILAATDKYLRATMTTRKDIVGQHFFDVFPDDPSDPDASGARNLRSSLDRARRTLTPEAVTVQKYGIRQPSGEFEERYWTSLSIPIVGAHGELEYIIHSVEDVTEFVLLKRSRSGDAEESFTRSPSVETEILRRSQEVGAANEELKAANEELALRTAELHDSLQTMQTFTYSIAHDLRAPLRALESFSTVVLEEYLEKLDETGKDYLNRIKSAARRMDLLVCDLLAYGQLTQVEVTAGPVSLDQAVAKVLVELDAELRARNSKVEVQRPLPTVVGNPVLINQVLANLLQNAVKFVPPERSPEIRIFMREFDHRVQLCVRDNGIGIAPAYHARIFELFTRLHRSTEYSGTGIGLALVKKAMERMMGKVGVESESGAGSCFWLEFRTVKSPRTTPAARELA